MINAIDHQEETSIGSGLLEVGHLRAHHLPVSYACAEKTSRLPDLGDEVGDSVVNKADLNSQSCCFGSRECNRSVHCRVGVTAPLAFDCVRRGYGDARLLAELGIAAALGYTIR